MGGHLGARRGTAGGRSSGKGGAGGARGPRFRIDLLIFDLDGTLADTVHDIWRSTNVMRRALGLTPLSLRTVRRHIGHGGRRVLGKVLPLALRHSHDEAVGIFWAHHRAHLLDRSRLYPGVVETLRRFRRTPKVVLTNRALGLALPLLKGLGIARHFRAVVGGDAVALAKPSPDPIWRLLEDFGAAADRALVVGDSEVDIQAGRAAGIHTCAVTYGYGAPADLRAARPDFLIRQFSDLCRYVSRSGTAPRGRGGEGT
ncbi:MAG TPA: HAD-IA family hydrolase [Candidatus Sulfotelmatobacter sp.]|nr:HAD-IA family hydrolase [Candidatus Sulfotelmatobacter sp.]